MVRRDPPYSALIPARPLLPPLLPLYPRKWPRGYGDAMLRL